MRRLVAVCLVALCVIGVVAVSAEDTPTLTTEQKLQAQNVILVWQVKQLQAQAAQRDAEDAKAAVIKFAASLQKDGYTLDLQTLTYAPTKPKP